MVRSKNDSVKVVKESLAEVLARKLGLKMGQLRSMDREFQILKEVLYTFQNMRWQNTVREGTADKGESFEDPMRKFQSKRSWSSVISAAAMKTVWEKSVGYGFFLELETIGKEWKGRILMSSLYSQYIETLEIYVTEIDSWMTA